MSARLGALGTAVVAASLLWLAAAPARADYVISICGNDGAGADHVLRPYTNNGWTRNYCLPGYGEQTKVWGNSYLYQGGYLQFQPPSGSSIVAYRANARGVWEGSNYAWLLDGGDPTNFAPGDSDTLYSAAHVDGSWISLARQVSWKGLRIATYCNASFCAGNYALVDWKNLYVTIRDGAGGPSLSGESGLWNETGWTRGVREASYSASDNVGVKIQRIELDPGGAHGFGWPVDAGKSCDFTYVVPCPASTSTSAAIDTAQVADGSHVLRYAAMDSSGNWRSEDRTLKVDNHAPAAPVAVAADSGGAADTPSFTIRWTNPSGQAAPLTTLHYTTCRAGATTACDDGAEAIAHGASDEQNAVTGAFGISEPGAYKVSLWLEDAAGNADRTSASEPVTLTLGDDTPAAPVLDPPPAGWLRDTSYTQRISYPAGAAEPVSGVAGYAVTTDGSAPGSVVNADGRDAAYEFAPLEGITTIKARTVTTGGAASSIASATLRVDRTAPATSVLGAGTPGVPSSGALDLTLIGTDQPGLSGMGGADPDDAIESGGHVDYSLDGGATVQVRGDEATLRVSEPGSHTITFRAYDVAGNASPPRTVNLSVGAPPGSAPRDHHGFWDESSSGATFAAAPSFAASCPPQATLTARADAWIDQAAPAANHGADAALLVWSGAAQNARALLAFDLPAIGSCTVAGAELRLHGSSSRALVAYRLGSAWDPASVVWQDRPGPSGTPSAGIADGGRLTFDVTSQVRGLYRSGNDGVVVQDASESAAAAASESFESSEASDPSLRPVLVVTFG